MTPAFGAELLAGRPERRNELLRSNPPLWLPNMPSATWPARNSSSPGGSDIPARNPNRSGLSGCARGLSEVLYQVARFEDSALAARELVKLDPTSLSVGTDCAVAAALDRRARSRSRASTRAIDPENCIGKFGFLDYAWRRAGRMKPVPRCGDGPRWPKDAAFARQLLPWALGEPSVE